VGGASPYFPDSDVFCGCSNFLTHTCPGGRCQGERQVFEFFCDFAALREPSDEGYFGNHKFRQYQEIFIY
jgi:hypothetical protein